jgi:hypothetical protein
MMPLWFLRIFIGTWKGKTNYLRWNCRNWVELLYRISTGCIFTHCNEHRFGFSTHSNLYTVINSTLLSLVASVYNHSVVGLQDTGKLGTLLKVKPFRKAILDLKAI